ncbi:MAG: hypothetical protein QM722_03130 [Piscinibacter sp.]
MSARIIPESEAAGLRVIKPDRNFSAPRTPPMGPVDALWHLLNFFAPALGVGVITAAMARLVWRRELQATGLGRLALWACAGCAVGLVAALVLFGRDGKMAGYGLMLLCCSLTLWWAGLRGARP